MATRRAGRSALWTLYRPLLRLAKQHDASPSLKFLLPSVYCSPKDWNATVHSYAQDVRDGFRTAMGRQGLKDTSEMDQLQWVLKYNLNRGAIWTAQTRHAELNPSTAAVEHPNINWFSTQLEEKKEIAMSMQELEDSGNRSELDVVISMEQAGCKPTAKLYLQALNQLACRQGAFQKLLEVLWHWDIYGASDARASAHSMEIASALVRSALLDQTYTWSPGSWRHPLGVWTAFVAHIGAPPSGYITNQMLRQTACVAKRVDDRREAQEVAKCLRKALMHADTHGIALTGSTFQTLTYAFSRAGDMEASFDCVKEMVSAGTSIPADLSLELLEWAAEEGDRDKLSYLEEEMATSGKAQYLAALNSPTC